MKIAPLVLLLLVACGSQEKPASAPSAAAPTVQAAAANQFGHLSPIHLPKGEFFDGFLVTPENRAGGTAGTPVEERYFFATSTHMNNNNGTHTLRNSKGVPVLVVIDPQ